MLCFDFSGGFASCPGDKLMAAQTEILETPRLDSESESDFRKRFKLMTELGPEIVHGCESGRAGLDYAAGQAV
jgi:hypothetical protein